ncbi:MAG TPA: nucleotide disphospho-sugar-binding domain-containing protein [Actinotalea sp.]|nr:nucleotide disphospho-sugar-binding domain-containing protein [Actinotalea sp.]
MATILAYTSPARGHLFPLVPILDELRSRGHRIAVRTLASEVPRMSARGFDAAAISPAIEAIAHTDASAKSTLDGLRRSVQTFCDRAPHDGADLRQAIDAIRPYALLVDVNAWGAIAAAQAWGGPWSVFCPYPLPLGSSDTPPYGPGLAPARGPIGRLRDRLLRPVVMGSVERIMVPQVNAVRRTFGLAGVASADDLFTTAPLTLYLTAAPFEYPHRDWPASIVEVGPCVWEPPSEPPAWLAEIEGPVVLVTTSSEFQDDGVLVRTALAALADEPVTVVATVPAGDPADYAAPPNARVERFVPHGAVLDRAVCAITHGGMGATQKALAHAVPVCAVPFGRDQLEVARRVVMSGAGTSLAARRLSATRLRAAVRAAQARSDGARRIAEAFAATGAGATAADAVETHLLGRHPAPRPAHT